MQRTINEQKGKSAGKEAEKIYRLITFHTAHHLASLNVTLQNAPILLLLLLARPRWIALKQMEWHDHLSIYILLIV